MLDTVRTMLRDGCGPGLVVATQWLQYTFDATSPVFSQVQMVSLKSKDAACSLVAAALPQLLRKPDETVDTRLLLAAG